MKLFLDLQAIQGSATRGIGRYSRAFTKAIVRNAGDAEIWLGLSDLLPVQWEDIDDLRGDRIPSDHVVTISLPGPTAERNPDNHARARIAEWIREARIAEVRPDLVHICSLFEGFAEDNTTSIDEYDDRLKTSVTLHDLIPPGDQSARLENDVQRSWYFRKIEQLRKAECLLAVSESSKRDAIEHLGIAEERIVVIGGGADAYFSPVPIGDVERASLGARFKLDRPFVLCVGNSEVHKNLDGMIASFASLPADIRSSHQLAIVGSMSSGQRQRMVALAANLGISKNQISFPGHVSDSDLRLLYSACALFVFPSKPEGLGLPVLEAMACAAPVIGSDAGAVKEAISRPDALFDASSPSAIGCKMYEVLRDVGFAQSLRDHSEQRARDFDWDKSARIALDAFRDIVGQSAERLAKAISRPSTRKPRLAYLSPLPPVQSGISDYSAELLPALAEHYEIDVILAEGEIGDVWINENLRVRTPDWFIDNGDAFDSVLYNIGNSQFHIYMLDLMEIWPGTVILHDFYLSHLFRHIGDKYGAEHWYRPLYDSHGLAAVRAYTEAQANGSESFYDYPCCLPIIRSAIGVVTHSAHAHALAASHFGEGAASQIRVLPFSRRLPEKVDRVAARRRLGIPDDQTLVCSFGNLIEFKTPHLLIDAWQMAELGNRGDCQLIFVGNIPSNRYARALKKRLKTELKGSRISATGFAEPQTYQDYLAASDLAVQLRANSRGETSASAHDCLAHGLPLVVNAHGAMIELPDDAVVKVSENFAVSELATVLVDLVDNPARRKSLSERGLDHARRVHDPRQVAIQMREAIEDFERGTSNGRQKRLATRIAGFDEHLSTLDLTTFAKSISQNAAAIGPPEILIDVTIVSSSDRRTGIERVVRNVADCLTRRADLVERVEFVKVTSGIHYARSYAAQQFNLPPLGRGDTPARLLPGDIFLGVDWNPQIPATTLENLRRRNIPSYFVVYDILPVQMPHVFLPDMEPVFRRWLDSIVKYADGIFCISRAVADDLFRYLDEHPPQRHAPLKIGVLRLASDLDGSTSPADVTAEQSALIEAACSRSAVLMVGTLEPRKGHEQALVAFESLWQEENSPNLIIAGKAGWSVDALVRRLANHPERGKRIFWFDTPDDGTLERLYQSASLLLAASIGEGFGLPVIEAARHGLPLLLRNLPVFRETAGANAKYFSGNRPQDIADAVTSWFAADKAGEAPASSGIEQVNWTESTRRLLSTLKDDQWYRLWKTPT